MNTVKTHDKEHTFLKSGKIGSCILGYSYWKYFRVSTFLITFLISMKEIQLFITTKISKLGFGP